MQAVTLYLTMSAMLSAPRTVTTVLFIPGAATSGAEAAPTVTFKLSAVERESPRLKSPICRHIEHSIIMFRHCPGLMPEGA